MGLNGEVEGKLTLGGPNLAKGDEGVTHREGRRLSGAEESTEAQEILRKLTNRTK